MKQVNLMQNNSASVAGEIISNIEFSHKTYGEKFYTFNLKSPRLSNTSDILPITISERLFNKEELVCGAYVSLDGQLRSYNNYKNKKSRLILTMFVHELSYLDDSSLSGKSNQIYLNGFICKPPIYRTTPFGREIADVLLAVNRLNKGSDYIPCIAWGRSARFVGKLNVGDNLKIWGRIQSREYQKKIDDNTIIDKVAYEVSISKIEETETCLESLDDTMQEEQTELMESL